MYSSFDSIICISLKENVERQEHVRRVAKALNIPFRFHLVDRHPVSGSIGCFESHIQVIRMMYESGVKIGIILEDDLVPSPGYSKKLLQDAIDFMKSNDRWEMFQLGYSPWKSGLKKFMNSPRVSRSIVKYTGLLTHAYCLSRRGMQRILSTVDDTIMKTEHIDQWYCDIITRGYCIAPILFDQKWCQQSDNILTGTFASIWYSQIFRCFQEEYQIHYFVSSMPYLRVPLHVSVIVITTLIVCFVMYKKRKYLRR
jgi:GR25 family glycosyltransferase involved in LPS biosynthesis